RAAATAAAEGGPEHDGDDGDREGQEHARCDCNQVAAASARIARVAAAVAARAGVYFTGAEISLSDFEIQIDAKETSATVKCLARLTAEQGGQPRRDDRRVDFKLAKVDGDWLIDSIFVSDVNEEQEAEAVPALP
ncbi:MAG TPA: hypothetical protein PKD61_16275, partial [Polyangiaceae bacterium]|nr:hypothetical protein [Polyangiaceae bacterium]